MKKYDSTTARMVYLNGNGSRFVAIDRQGNRERIPVSFDGKTVKQVAVKYWETCGNFAFPCVRNGKQIIPVYANEGETLMRWEPFDIRHPKA